MILSLLSSKGGVSKSTLALSLAYEWQALGQRVRLVDADPQRTCAKASVRAADAGYTPPATVQQPRGLHLLQRNSAFDVTVIDTPGVLGDALLAALAITDVALLLVSPSGPDAWTVAETLQLVLRAKAKRPALRCAILITRKIARSRLGEDARAALEEFGTPVFRSSTHNRIAWAEAVTAGVGVTAYAPHSAAANELRAVLQEIETFNRGAAPNGNEEAIAAGK